MIERRLLNIFRVVTGSLFALFVLLCVGVMPSFAQVSTFERQVISGGMVRETTVDSVRLAEADSIAQLKPNRRSTVDTSTNGSVFRSEERRPFISDSMSLSKVCWLGTVMPGFGQIYNKQYLKLPVLYGTMALGTTLFIHENRRYQGYKTTFDELTLGNLYRTDEVNQVQTHMIRSNTRRQLYLGVTAATYLYSLVDATLNFPINEATDIKRATTLATIFPGAGQLYNKSYWKVPFVVGGFASMIYVLDWNNRGYTRFKKAYRLTYAYEADPESYPDGSLDEFSGRYTADYLRSIRDSYRRNRDLSLILMAGLYILQIIDAHVDAHFQDYDISDDLSVSVVPVVTPSLTGDSSVGVGMSVNF
ncbi:MAG: DUF5683 domain-containing protein [Rikenellaceae bacterium]